VKNPSIAVWTALVSLLFASSALAAQPVDWQMSFQPAATGIMEEIAWFERYTLWFIVPITLFVLALLVICVVRFRRGANPVPSKTSHNTLIEVVWTVAPVVILLFLAIPSFQLLSAQYDPPEEAALTIKATGYQWYWGYEYQPAAVDAVAEGEAAVEGEEPAAPVEVVFDSIMLQEGDREAAGKTDLAAYPRLLAVDNEVVVPVNQTVRLLVTAGDVLHSFAMPAFGVKMDAVPGRLNETWFRAEREGLYYGQCSELCGKDHAFMPIAIRVVSQEQFDGWMTAAASDIAGANRELLAAIEADASVDVADNNAQ
jgi:cytochrome c oxidase subunit 2